MARTADAAPDAAPHSTQADFTRGFVHNHWYAAAWAGELTTAPLARRILDMPLVLFRDGAGKAGALEDMCPHRLAPLSLGECVDGGLRCGYHGMLFDTAGACINIPGQGSVPPTAKVRAFPVIERYGLIWVWAGTASPDASLMPVLPGYGEAGWSLLDQGYQHHQGNYRIEIENLMDPAHTTFLHKETIGNQNAKDVPVQVSRAEWGLCAYRWIENVPPSRIDLAARDFGDQRVDRRIAFNFQLPATSFVDVAVIPAGSPRDEASLSANGLRSFSYKFLTPETGGSTHFFWLHLRNFRPGDTAFETGLLAALNKTYLEDADMVTAIQRQQERTGLRQQTALAIDRAPIMAIRMIDRMIAAEAEPAPEPAPA